MIRNRVKSIILASLLASLLLLLAACSVTTQEPEATVPAQSEETVMQEPTAETVAAPTEEPVEEPTDVAQESESTGFEDLVEALLLAGYAVELGDSIEQPFFSSQGQILLVDGAEVQLFEYVDNETAAAEAALIAPGAGSVGTSMMTWVATPHFYAQENIIALYVGDDDHVIAGLQGALGQPVAEGQGQPLLPLADTVEVMAAALTANDFAMLQGLMSNPFTIGYWQSQGQVLTPAEAEEQLRLILLPNPAAVSFVRDPAQFPDLGQFDPYSAFGPDVNIVDLVYSQGWGGDGLGEAILLISEDAEGQQHWRGIIYGLAGFSVLMASPPQESTLPFEPAVYRNEENGFEFDYPASWTFDEEVLGSRASGRNLCLKVKR